MTLFKALYGRKSPIIPPYLSGNTRVTTLDEFLTHRQLLLNKLKENLQGVRHRMKQIADKHRREVTFEVWEWVYLCLQPYRQLSVATRHAPKLAYHFYGSFQVLKRIGPVAYELELPRSTKIHPVFYVSLLLPCRGQPDVQTCPLSPQAQGTHPLVEPIRVLGRETVSGKHGPKDQVLVLPN